MASSKVRRALAALSKGRRDEALNILRKGQKKEGSFLDWIEKGLELVDDTEIANEVVKLYEVIREELTSNEEKASLLLNQGRLLIRWLNQPEEGLRLLKQAFEHNVKDLTPIREAREIYRSFNQPEGVAQLLMLELHTCPESPRRDEKYLSLALIQMEELNDLSAAETSIAEAGALGVDVSAAEKRLEEIKRGNLSKKGASKPKAQRERAVRQNGKGKEGAQQSIIQEEGITESVESAEIEWLEYQGELTYEMCMEESRAVKGVEAAEILLIAPLVLPPPRAPEKVKKAFSKAVESGANALDAVNLMRSRFVTDREAWGGVVPVIKAQIKKKKGDGALRRAAYHAIFYALGDYEEAFKVAGEELSDSADVIESARSGDWRQVLSLLLAHYRGEEADRPEVMAERHSADIALGLGNTDKAINLLRKLHRENALNHNDKELLKALYRKEEKWLWLINHLKQESNGEESTAEKLKILRTMARVYRSGMQQESSVVRTFNEILRLDATDSVALEALTEIHQKNQKWPALIDVLKKRLLVEDDQSIKLSLLSQVATLYETRLKNSSEATRAYEEILSLNPENSEALSFLVEMYRKRKDWKRFVDVSQRHLDQAGGEKERLTGLRELALIATDKLRDIPLSGTLWEALLEGLPRDPESLENLTRIYELQKDWTALDAVLKQRLESVGEGEMAALLERRATVLSRNLGEPEQAVTHYESLIELEPGNRKAQESLRKLYVALGRWDELEASYAQLERWSEYSRVLEKAAADSQEQDKAVELLHRAATVWLERSQDGRRAVRVLEKITGLDPGNIKAARLLAPVYEEQKQFKKLERVLGVLLEASSEPEELFELELTQGRVMAKMGQKQQAFDRLLAALERKPERFDLIEDLESLATSRDEKSRLVSLCQKLVESAPLKGGGKREVQLRLGYLYMAFDEDSNAAEEVFNEVLDAEPSELKAMDGLMSIYEKRNDFEGIISLLERKLEGAQSPEERGNVYVSMAEIYERELSDPDRAVECYEIALTCAEDKPSITEQLERLYTQSEQWQELIGIYQQKLEAQEGQSSRTEILGKMAQIQEEKLGDIQGAIASYEVLLEEGATSMDNLVSLEKLFEQEGMYLELTENLNQQLALHPEGSKSRGSLLFKLALLTEEHLNDLERALEIYEQVLTAGGEQGKVLEQLERLLVEPELTDKISQLLVPIYESKRDYNLVVSTLEVQLQNLDSPKERAQIQRRMASIYESHLGDDKAALAALFNASGEGAVDETDLDHLERLAKSTGEFESLAGHLSDCAVNSDSQDEKVSLYRRLGVMAETELKDKLQAVDCWQSILEEIPGHSEAMAALHRLFEQLKQWDDLIAVKRLQLANFEENGDTTGGRPILFQIATIYEQKLGDEGSASSVMEEVLEVAPEDERALKALEKLYRSGERWSELVSLLERRVMALNEVELASKVRLSIAEIYLKELGDHIGALDSYRAVLESNPADDDALNGLVNLYVEQGDWAAVIQILDQRIAQAGDRGESLQWHYRKARIYHDELNDLAAAIASYEEILKEDIGHQGALSSLEEMIERNDDLDQASRVLIPVYESTEQWPQLAGLILKLGEESMEPQLRAEHFLRVGELLEEKLEDTDGAITVLCEALSQVPERIELVERIFKMRAESCTLEDMSERMMAVLSVVQDDNQKLNLGNCIAENLTRSGADTALVTGIYEELSEIDPDNDLVLNNLARVQRDAGQWSSLVETLERQIQLSGAEEQSPLKLQLAEVLFHNLEGHSEAVSVLSEIVQDEQSHEGAISLLEEMLDENTQVPHTVPLLEPHYRATSQWSALFGARLALLDHLDSNEERFSLLTEISQIALEEMEDNDAAFTVLCQAFVERPEEAEVRVRLGDLADQLNSHNNLVEIIKSVLESQELEDGLAAELGELLARIYKERLKDTEKATTWYEYVLERNGETPAILAVLEILYSQHERWEDLTAIMLRQSGSTTSDSNQAAIFYRQGQIYRDQLSDVDSAVDAFQRALEAEPTHVDTFNALETLLVDGGQTDALLALYEQQSNQLSEDTLRAEIFSKMATLYQYTDEASEQAVEIWHRVLELQPADETALTALEEIYEATERDAELVEILEIRLSNTDDPLSQGPYLERIAVASRRQGDLNRTVRAYEEILSADPSSRTALLALGEIYEAESDTPSWAANIAKQIEAGILQGDTLKAAYEQLAKLYGEELGQPEEAINAWHIILEGNPENIEALDRLEQLYLDQGEPGEAASVMEKKVAFIEDSSELISRWLAIAVLWQSAEGGEASAIKAYEKVHQLEPSHSDAFTALDIHYREASQWNELIELNLNRLQFIEQSEARDDLLYATVEIYTDELEDWASALLVLARIYQEQPWNEDLAQRMEEAAEKSGTWTDLVEVFTGAIDGFEQSHGAEATLPVHQRLARYFAGPLEKLEKAEQHLKKILEIEPENEQALIELEAIFQASGDFDSLTAVLEQLCNVSDSQEKQIEIYLKIGIIQQAHAGDDAAAVQFLEKALALEPGHEEALATLCEILQVSERWGALVEALERRINWASSPEEVTRFQYEMALLYVQHLDAPEKAVEIYHDLLLNDPEQADAREQLKALYAKQEQWEQYLDLLFEQLSGVSQPEVQCDTYREMAHICEARIEDVDRAIEFRLQALSACPGHLETVLDLQLNYEKLSQWDELNALIETESANILDDQVIKELYLVQSDVCINKLDDISGAIAAHEKCLEIEPGDIQVIRELAGFYQRNMQWSDCSALYSQLLENSQEDGERVDLYCQLGSVLHEGTDDLEGALKQYQAALEIDPQSLLATEGVIAIQIEREDWEGAIETLGLILADQNDMALRSVGLSRLGQIYQNNLGDTEQAILSYQEAVDIDPDNEVAALALVDHYFSLEKWARVIPLLERLLDKDGGDTAGVEGHLFHHRRLGLAYEELGQDSKAILQFEKVYGLDATDRVALEGLARLMGKAGEHEKSVQLLSEIDSQHGVSLEQEDRILLLLQQGESSLAMGEKGKAQECFEKALAEDDENTEALKHLIEIHKTKVDWERVVDCIVRLAKLLQNDLERFSVLLELGDILKDKLGRVEEAVKAYKDALKHNEDSIAVLHRLLEIFSQSEQWKRAAEILVKMAQLETDPARLAVNCQAIGFILLDHLEDHERAHEYFVRALDTHLNLDRIEAFQGIERIFTQKKDWKKLEREYRSMIKRVAEAEKGEEFDTIRLQLWLNLGEIYRTRIEDHERAIEAYKTAALLAPDRGETFAILSQLYDISGGEESDIISTHHSLIQNDPFQYDSYHTLFKRYLAGRDFDAAWCISAALTLFKKADDQESAYYQRYYTSTPPISSTRLAESDWQVLYHQSLSSRLCQIMAVFGGPLKSSITEDPAVKWKIHRKKDLLDLSAELPFVKYYNYSAQILGGQTPNVFVRRDKGDTIANANAHPTALVVSEQTIQGQVVHDLVFEISKALSLLRDDLYIGSAYPRSANLKEFFYAALLSTGFAGGTEITPNIERLVREIKRSGKVKRHLKQVTDEFLASGEQPNVSTWLSGIEYTSDRVGLLLSGDVVEAVQSLRKSGESFSKATVKERIKELVLFSTSESYLHMRKQMGITVAD